MKSLRVLMAALAAARSPWPQPRRPSGTCRPPIRRTTSTPRTSCSSRPTSTRRRAASSRSPCIRTRRCSRRRRSSAPSRAGRRRSARSCSSTSRTKTRSTASTACRSSRRSYAEASKLYKASKKALDDKLAKQGMKLLYTVPWPPQGIFTNRTLTSVADMKGLKWRAYSPATARIAELVGAQPVTVQAAEVSQALATGVDRFVHVVRRDRLRLQDLRAHQVLLRHAGLAAEERGDRQPEGVRRARQGDAGRGAQGRGRRRSARLEAVGGEERLVHRPAQGQGHDHRQAAPSSSRGPAQGRQRTCSRSG